MDMNAKFFLFVKGEKKISAYIEQMKNGLFLAYVEFDGIHVHVGKEYSDFESDLEELVRIILEGFEKGKTIDGSKDNNLDTVRIIDQDPRMFFSIDKENEILKKANLNAVVEAG